MHFCINWWKQRNQPKKRIVSEIATSRSFLCLCFSRSRSQSVRLVAVGFIYSTQFNNFPMLAIAECIRVAVSIWPTFIPFRFSVLNCIQWIVSRFDFFESLSSNVEFKEFHRSPFNPPAEEIPGNFRICLYDKCSFENVWNEPEKIQQSPVIQFKSSCGPIVNVGSTTACAWRMKNEVRSSKRMR